MRRLRTIVVLMALLVLLIGSVGRTAAATADPTPTGPLNITISPDTQELVAKPGGSVTAKFRVRNNGTQTEHLKASIKTFSAVGQKGTPQLLDPKPQDDFVHWAVLSTPTLTAEPNVWEDYTITINPPKTAAFGYYYAVDFTRVVQAKAAPGNNFVISVDSLLLLDVKAPGEVRQASLAEFSTPNKSIEFLPQNFTIRMRNTGNVHVAPRGDIYLYKGKKPVGIIEVNSVEGNILPNSYRTYTARWTDGTPVYKTVTGKTKDGQPSDKTALSWDNFRLGKLRYGKYTAQLEMIYNNGQYDVPLTTELSFWVIPWRIIIVFVFIVLLILAGVWALFIRPLRRRIKGTKHRHARLR